MDEESPFHTLFRRWSRTKLAIGELAQVCLDGSTPSICYANTAKLGRTVEDAGPYGLVRFSIVGRGLRAVEGASPYGWCVFPSLFADCG